MKDANGITNVEESIHKNHLIIARNQNIELIHKQFDQTLLGGMGLSIVTGKAGVGKTYLIDHSEDFFQRNNVTYIKTKFKQHSKEILRPVITIINTIIEHIFTLPFKEYQLIQKNYTETLKNETEIILSLCPEAIKLFSEQNKKVNQVNISSNQQNKISNAIYQFIKVSSKVLFPLVVFIDDLQWADDISLTIIKQLIKNNDLSMHLILSYRDNENTNMTKDLTDLGENKDSLIKLCEFKKEDIIEYIKYRFNGELDNNHYLIETLYSLTCGNPFYINMIVDELLKNDIIKNIDNKGKYEIDFQKIKKLAIPKDVEQIIVRKLDEIHEEDKKLLEIIACFGGTIEHNLLSILTNENNQKLNSQIDRLCNIAILIKETSNIKGCINYTFVHDIIYNIVYQKQTKQEKNDNYRHILSTIIKYQNGNYAKEHSQFMADLMLKIEKHFLLDEKIQDWITILYYGGASAKNIGALNHALNIYELCEYLLINSDIQYDCALYLNIQLDYMECQFISENENKAEKKYKELLKTFRDKDKRLKIKLRYINFYAYSANWEMVISLGTEILDNLDFTFNTNSIPRDLIKSRILYSSKRIEKIKTAPMIKNKRILTILEVLTTMFPATNRIDLKKFTLVTLKLAILTAHYGNSMYSPIGYASYCYILFFVFKDYKKGDQLQKITLELLENKEMKLKRSIAYALIGTFTYHWTNSFESTINCLSQSIQLAEEENEYMYSNYAIVFSIITKYVMGRPLLELRQYINECQSRKKRLENYLTRHMYDVYLSQIEYLKNGDHNYNDCVDEKRQSFYDTIVLNAKMIKVHRLYLEGKLQEAYNLVNEIESLVWQHNGFILNGDFAFYSTLTRLAIHNCLGKKEKKANKRIIEKHIKEMKIWADTYKTNHYARYLLMQAEYDYYLFPNTQVENDYYRAMVFAKKNNNVQLEALANLLAAKHYRYNLKLSKFYAKEASQLYQQWGANHIADLICKEMGIENNSQNNMIEKSNSAKNKIDPKADALQYISKMKNMPENDIYNCILDYVIENHYANYCLVLFEKNGEMYAKYSKKTGEKVNNFNESVNMNYIKKLPHSIIRYVARTEKRILLSSNKNSNIFNNDAFLLENGDIAVACIPIKCSDILIGVVYLEINSWEVNENICDIVSGLIPTMMIKEIAYHDGNMASQNIALTRRESEILQLVNKGLSNSQISEKLFVTVGTIRNHLSNIYSKLEVNSRVQAIVKAKELEIIK